MKKELMQTVLQEQPGVEEERGEGAAVFRAGGELTFTVFLGLPGLDAVHRVTQVRLRADAAELLTQKGERYVVGYPRIKALKLAGGESAGGGSTFPGFRPAAARTP
jgi:hypothetical protein